MQGYMFQNSLSSVTCERGIRMCSLQKGKVPPSVVAKVTRNTGNLSLLLNNKNPTLLNVCQQNCFSLYKIYCKIPLGEIVYSRPSSSVS